MAAILLSLDKLIEKRKKNPIQVTFGDKTISLKFDVDDSELSQYLQAVMSAGEAEDNEVTEMNAILNALESRTEADDTGLWDDFIEESGAGIVIFRQIFAEVQDKYFEAKSGKKDGA